MVSGSSTAMQSSVLALNRSFVAVHVVPVRRAICLLWKGMAEVISVENGSFLTYDLPSWLEVSELRAEFDEFEEHDDLLQSVNFVVQVPRVIRLLNYERVPRNVVKFSRRNVFLRDEYRCQYCDRKYSHSRLSLDHVMPRSRGGGNTWENIVTACLDCNVRKGGRTPKEAGMKLLSEPSRPHRNPVLTHQLNSRKYSSWKNFVR